MKQLVMNDVVYVWRCADGRRSQKMYTIGSRVKTEFTSEQKGENYSKYTLKSTNLKKFPIPIERQTTSRLCPLQTFSHTTTHHQNNESDVSSTVKAQFQVHYGELYPCLEPLRCTTSVDWRESREESPLDTILSLLSRPPHSRAGSVFSV